jgi:hypothetical protein
VKVTLPPGSTVLRAPRKVIDTEAYDELCKRHSRTYTCVIDAPRHGDTDKSLEFLLKTSKSGKGKVELPDEPLPRRDTDSANDTATIALHAKPDRSAIALTVVLASIATAAGLLATRHRWIVPLRRIVRRHIRMRKRAELSTRTTHASYTAMCHPCCLNRKFPQRNWPSTDNV